MQNQKIVIKVSSVKINNYHTKSITVPSKKKEREALNSLSGILMFQLQESIRRCIRSALSVTIAFRFTNLYDVTIGRINQDRIGEKLYRRIKTLERMISALILNADHP